MKSRTPELAIFKHHHHTELMSILASKYVMLEFVRDNTYLSSKTRTSQIALACMHFDDDDIGI